VQMVGYPGLLLADAQEKMRKLITKHGEDPIQKASEELFDMATSENPFVRLKAEARKLAWQLLGPPPDHKPVDMMAEIMASGERLKADPKPTPEKKPRRKKATRKSPAPSPPAPARAIPIMQQYRETKERHPGMMLIFRVGDFYELYETDAEKAAMLLG